MLGTAIPSNRVQHGRDFPVSRHSQVEVKQVQATGKWPTVFPGGVFYPKGLHCTVCSLRVFTHVEFLVLCFVCSPNIHIIPEEWFIFFQFGILGHMPKVEFSHQTARFRTSFPGDAARAEVGRDAQRVRNDVQSCCQPVRGQLQLLLHHLHG